jgi:pyruvate dehydrogenase E2 component (dihydrolipoamide acetyltransferase)
MQTFNLPDAGEGLTEAEILAWHVAPGDTVVVNQVIVEIETAKAAVELPCPFAGTVAELLVAPGDTVAVGAPIITIREASEVGAEPAGAPGVDANATADAGGAKIGEVTADGRIATLVGYVAAPGAVTRRRRRPSAPADAAEPAPPAAAPPAAATAPASPVAVPGDDRQDWSPSRAERGRSAISGDHEGRSVTPVPLAKPPVRKLARDLGIDLRGLTGSGPGGSITRDDLRGGHPTPNGTAATSSTAAGPNGAPTRTVPAASGAPTEAANGAGEPEVGVRRVPVRSLRRATAQAMVSSAFTAPHVTEFLTVDVTPMIELRDRLRASREFSGLKLSPLTFAAKAVCLAARRTPEINASWNEHEIVYYDRVQLGIAAATPRGLLVPKIRDADRLTLPELARALTALTDTARAGTTEPKDLVGGTFTITNVGVFGVDTGTPIINPGESAILALGAVKPAPWVVDGQLAVRTVCQLALSFDHRVVDGEQGSRFLADVGALLADPGLALTY